MNERVTRRYHSDGTAPVLQPEDVASAVGKIAAARRLANGHWEIKLEDGATWAQIDASEIPIDPKPGQAVKIRKASLGSYMMTVGNQREVKVHRVE